MHDPRLEPVVLEGRHVRLEPMRVAHVDGLWNAGADPELWLWTGRGMHSRDDMERYVRTALGEQEAGTALPFVTCVRESGAVVGSTRFAAFVPAHRRVEIGWTWIAREWQRTSVNTEAKLLMLAHAFETLALNRVELKTDAQNETSRRAILRLGATEEGLFRKHMVMEAGRLRDTVYFSIVAQDWPGVRARLEDKLARPPARDR